MKGWIGVDLDGTLAKYDGWKGGEIGEPIEPMVRRVRDWLNAGTDVRIVTARVAVTNSRNQVGGVDNAEFAAEQALAIGAWCVKHLGRSIPITATKDFGMIELWDDRCVRVVPNTGEPCCSNHRQPRETA